ncbi:hypothetical protein E2320_002494 [Naja naja]|nr:hypothetical protein E2320_002494 [Naja naja]
MDAVLHRQDDVENEVHNLTAMVLQLIQPMQNLAQLVPSRNHGSLPERFEEESQRLKTFLVQCELFFVVEFLNDQDNDLIMDNYQNFTVNFKGHLEI